MITLDQVLAVAHETFKVAASKGYYTDDNVTFRISTRLSRCLGLYTYDEKNQFGFVKRKHSIAISSRFNEMSAECIDTIRHEIAHFYAYAIFKDISHGPQWKEIAIALGASPKAGVKLAGDEPIAPPKARKKHVVTRARCDCSETLYRPTKNQLFPLKMGLISCPACKVKRLYMVKV